MLSFNQQYNISNGIFICYNQQLDYRLFHSKHSLKVREKYKKFFPYKKFETYTKENFVLTCLYIIFFQTPSSYRDMIRKLSDINFNEIKKFKVQLQNYEINIQKDINYLRQYKDQLTPERILKEFYLKHIKFYTAWFYLKFNSTTFEKSRIFKHIIRKLKFIMLYLSFNEKSVQKIKSLFEVLEL